MNNQYMNWTSNTQTTVTQIQISHTTYTVAIFKEPYDASKPDIMCPYRVHGDRWGGATVPERVWPRGVDNAISLELMCLPCAQVVYPPGRRPLTKKS